MKEKIPPPGLTTVSRTVEAVSSTAVKNRNESLPEDNIRRNTVRKRSQLARKTVPHNPSAKNHAVKTGVFPERACADSAGKYAGLRK